MATASMFSVNVKATGVSVVVPDDDTARLMYYLGSVTVGVGLDILQDDLVDWRNHWRLSIARKAAVFKAAVEFSPNEFLDKLIFQDDKGEVVKGTSLNEFCDISVACNVVSVQRDVVIAGKVQNVTKIMFFKSAWLEKYYIGPTTRIARAILGSKHCAHCKGVDGLCTCETCPRSSNSECQPLLNMLLGALTGTSISARSPSPAPVKNPNAHECKCDGCRKENFDGPRYKCTICNDFDLCNKCYQNDVHDMSHPFTKIDRPGSSPVKLAPRARPKPTPAPPVLRRVPPPPALPQSGPLPTYVNATAGSPYFYHDMTIHELKEYLRERGVTYSDILDRETLCRRVWEAHCDCMTMTELGTFLSENRISTANCRDVGSRRQKAKEAFQISARGPSASSRVQLHDVVTLRGLTRAEMNGKRAKVIQPDCGGGRAEVRLEESGKLVKVKFENLTAVNDSSDEYLD
jgi:hypothetical protein